MSGDDSLGEQAVMRGDGSFSIGSDVWPGVSKLIEEMGELHQVLGKLIALHGATDHWDGTDLRVRLVEEIGDVIGAVNFVTVENFTVRERIAVGQRAEEKLRLFESWHDEQGQPMGYRQYQCSAGHTALHDDGKCHAAVFGRECGLQLHANSYF